MWLGKIVNFSDSTLIAKPGYCKITDFGDTKEIQFKLQCGDRTESLPSRHFQEIHPHFFKKKKCIKDRDF